MREHWWTARDETRYLKALSRAGVAARLPWPGPARAAPIPEQRSPFQHYLTQRALTAPAVAVEWFIASWKPVRFAS